MKRIAINLDSYLDLKHVRGLHKVVYTAWSFYCSYLEREISTSGYVMLVHMEFHHKKQGHRMFYLYHDTENLYENRNKVPTLKYYKQN